MKRALSTTPYHLFIYRSLYRCVHYARLIILVLLCTTGACSAQSVLLVTIDTVRADHLHSFGYPLSTSPQLDRVARDGYIFTSAYTPVPLTLPSHTAMMTGSYPQHTGVYDNGRPFTSPAEATLAEIFKRRGFRTAAIVSTLILGRPFGLNRGFEYYNDDIARSHPGRVKRLADQDVDIALAWIRRHRGAPFFLWIHLYDVHRPYRLPPELGSKFHLPYDASIAFADRELGRLFGYLREMHLYNSMTIAILGDHGEGLGEHGEETHGFFIYDSTLHIPLILKPPHTLAVARPRGTSIATPVETLDIYPTLLNLSFPKIRYSPHDGHSLLESLRGSNNDKKRAIFAENRTTKLHFGWSEIYSIRIGSYKFIDVPHPELYNTEVDPGEENNLIESNSAIATTLRSRLAGSYEAARMAHSEETGSLHDLRLIRLLESLGYVAPVINFYSGAHASPIDPKDRAGVIQLFMKANELVARGEVSNAIALTRTALALANESPPLHRLMGTLLLKTPPDRNRLESAGAEFAEELLRAPDDLVSLQQLAAIEMTLGDFRPASRLLNHYAALYPSNPAIYLQLADCLTHLGEHDAAITAYQKAITLSPESVDAWRSYGAALLATSQLKRSKMAIMRAIRIDPNNASLHELMSEIYLREGTARLSREEKLRASDLLNGASAK